MLFPHACALCLFRGDLYDVSLVQFQGDRLIAVGAAEVDLHGIQERSACPVVFVSHDRQGFAWLPSGDVKWPGSADIGWTSFHNGVSSQGKLGGESRIGTRQCNKD